MYLNTTVFLKNIAVRITKVVLNKDKFVTQITLFLMIQSETKTA